MACRTTWESTRFSQEAEDGEEKAWPRAWIVLSIGKVRQGKQLKRQGKQLKTNKSE